MTTLNPTDVATRIGAAWAQYLERDRRPSSPHPYVYASSWRACTRRMVYEMRGEDQPSFPAEVLAKFRRGNDRERDLLADLVRVGRDAEPPFQIIGQQEGFRLRDRKGRIAISGKVDARIHLGGHDGVRAPLEIKTWSPQLTDRIDTFTDLFDSPWTRPGAYQLLSYLFGAGEPFGFLLLDRSGIPRLLPVELDAHLDLVEEFLVKAEQAVDHLEAGTLPDYLAHDAAECQRCGFYGSACNPPLEHAAVEILINPALEQALERREQLRAGAKEFDKLDEDIKKRLRGTEHAIVGAFELKGKWGKFTKVVLPEALKKQYSETDPKGKFTLEITRLGVPAAADAIAGVPEEA